MNKPTKEAFERYLEVQKSGVVNMWDKEVQNLANISKWEHLYIIRHYAELAEEYGKGKG